MASRRAAVSFVVWVKRAGTLAYLEAKLVTSHLDTHATNREDRATED